MKKHELIDVLLEVKMDSIICVYDSKKQKEVYRGTCGEITLGEIRYKEVKDITLSDEGKLVFIIE